MSRPGVFLALLAVVVVAAPGVADAKKVTKTKTFSTQGPSGFGGPGQPVALSPIRAFVNGARIKHLTVKLRLDHPNVGEVNLYLLDNVGRVIELSTGNGGAGTGYGSGPNDCAGTFTVFDDSAPTPITSGAAPFEGSFMPELGPFTNAGELIGTWWLVASDSSSTATTGTIGCWQLEFTYAKKKK